jgi:eukaryotic-like serine/threonine-protein kinase
VSTGEPGSPSERIGSTLLGKWTLEKLLGEGGMASVYVARHKIGRLEAIKIMHSIVASSPELRARFEQEARLANRFRHPGAVEIRDIDTTEDGAPFLVMELLEGETLSAIARRSKEPLDAATVLRVADEVLDVLAAAHATGIIHRDIKPDNLLLTTEGRVKVLDFGIARLREGLSRDVKTHTGTTLGTVAYMAPEQAKGGAVDARVDIYAVGATMFRLLAGRRVHEAATEAERLAKLMSGAAEPLASAAPGVPPSVCAIVDRALAFDRADRYPDAAAMQADVRAARGEVPTSSSLGSVGRVASATAAPPVDPTRESTTRAEPPTVADPTRRDATAVAATVRGGGPPAPEYIKTERMPGALAVPAFAPVPAPAPVSAPPPAGALASLFASVVARKNRLYLLIVAGLLLLGALLVVAAIVVGLGSHPDAGTAESPAASEPATASEPPVPPVPSPVQEKPAAPPATHARPAPPPPKGNVRGR